MRRDYALDALRGLALLGMALSSLVPFGVLPAWMYHCQLPPPSHALNSLNYGITWVDVVFPTFLVAMGAAIPLSLTGKAPKPDDEAALSKWFLLVIGIIWRGVSIMFLAVAVEALKGYRKLDDMSWQWTALLMFFAMALTYIRMPKGAPKPVEIAIRVVGFAGTLFGLMTFGVEKGKFDVILMVLGNVSITGSLIYLLTRQNPQVRIAAIAAVTAIFLAYKLPGGIAKDIFDFDWGYGKGMYHKYLIVVLAGTFLGEALPEPTEVRDRVAVGLGALQAALGAFGAVLGFFLREMHLTFFLLVLLGMNSLWTVRKDALQTRAQRWGWTLLWIGFMLEPIEGGIRKDPTSVSYLVGVPGIACLIYAALEGWDLAARHLGRLAVSRKTLVEAADRVEGLAEKEDIRPGFLALVGQNPILGYIAITNLAFPLVRVTGLEQWQDAQPWTPWERAMYGLAITLSIGAICALCSRLKIFCRA